MDDSIIDGACNICYFWPIVVSWQITWHFSSFTVCCKMSHIPTSWKFYSSHCDTVRLKWHYQLPQWVEIITNGESNKGPTKLEVLPSFLNILKKRWELDNYLWPIIWSGVGYYLKISLQFYIYIDISYHNSALCGILRLDNCLSRRNQLCRQVSKIE